MISKWIITLILKFQVWLIANCCFLLVWIVKGAAPWGLGNHMGPFSLVTSHLEITGITFLCSRAFFLCLFLCLSLSPYVCVCLSLYVLPKRRRYGTHMARQHLEAASWDLYLGTDGLTDRWGSWGKRTQTWQAKHNWRCGSFLSFYAVLEGKLGLPESQDNSGFPLCIWTNYWQKDKAVSLTWGTDRDAR